MGASITDLDPASNTFVFTDQASLAVALTIQELDGLVRISWPASGPLPCSRPAPYLGAADWATVSPPPVLVNGFNVVTNPITGAQLFYGLRSP